MTEHTWQQVLTPYAVAGGIAAAMAAYYAWYQQVYKPGATVEVKEVKHNIGRYVG